MGIVPPPSVNPLTLPASGLLGSADSVLGIQNGTQVQIPFSAIRGSLGTAWPANEAPVVIVIGQSNADGRALVANAPTHLSGFAASSQVQIFQKAITRGATTATNQVDNGAWAQMDLTHLMSINNTTSTNASAVYGPELGIADAWKRTFSTQPLYIIKVAIGGVALATGSGSAGIDDNWAPSDGKIYTTFLNYTYRPAIRALLRQGLKPRLVGICWMQGESDVDISTATANGYGTALSAFIDKIRLDTGFKSARFLVGGLSSFTNEDSSDTNWTSGKWALVKAGQASVAATKSNVVLIPTDGTGGNPDLPRGSPDASRLHYTSLGQAILGKLFFDQLSFPGDQYTGTWTVERFNQTVTALGGSPTSLFTPFTNAAGIGLLMTGLMTNGTTNVNTMAFRIDTRGDRSSATTNPPVCTAKIPALNSHTNVEVQCQFYHDGDANTKAGFFLRGTWPDNGAIQQNGYLFLIRSDSVRVYKSVAGTLTQLGTGNVTNGVTGLHYYRFSCIGSTLSGDYSTDSQTWTNLYSVTDTTYAGPGDAFLTLYNGFVATPHCHFPDIFGLKIS